MTLSEILDKRAHSYVDEEGRKMKSVLLVEDTHGTRAWKFLATNCYRLLLEGSLTENDLEMLKELDAEDYWETVEDCTRRFELDGWYLYQDGDIFVQKVIEE